MKHILKCAALSLATLSIVLGSACSKSEEAPRGPELKMGLKDNIKSGDPVGAYDSVSLEPLPQVYESLYEYGFFKKKKTVLPLLADGMPSYSNGGTTVTIKLKKGVLFQDDLAFTDGKGRALKAQDFIYGWKRHAITRTHSEGYWIFDGKVVGYNDFQAKFKDEASEEAIMAAVIEGMKALDDHTIQLKLTKPYPQLIYILAMTFTAPMAIEVVKKYGPEIITHPVGTGPYRVVSWEPQSKVVLTKNPTYREVLFPAAKDIDEDFAEARAYAGRKLPLVDDLTFRVIHEDQPRWLEHIAGNIDQIEIPKDNLANAVKTDDIRALKDEWARKGFKLSVEEGVVYWYMFLNMKDKLLGSNKLLRQAMSAAFDRNGFLKLHRNGRGSIAPELNPPGTNDRCGKRTEPKFPYSVEKAKELLAKAGYPNGEGLPVINLDMRGADSTNRQLAEFLTTSMAAAGIKINPQLNTFPAFLDKRHKGNLQFAMGGWNMDYPDAENNLQLFYGPNEAPGPNESNYKNPRFDELYKKVAIMPSGPTRQALVCEMDEMLQDDAPAIFSHYESLYRMVGPRLRNYHTFEMAQNKYKFIDSVAVGK